MEVSSRDTAIRRYLSDTLAFRPGTGFQYSNENYEVLAAIIEVITGRDYEEFIKDEILIPCGMSQTFFWGALDDMDARRVAQKLRPLSNKVRARNWDYLGSGGIYSTSTDLFKLYRAVKSHTILTPRTTQLLFQPARTLSDAGVGYGWFVNETARHTMEYWTRGTEDWGHNAVLRWFPDERVVVIVCANTGEQGSKIATANRAVSDAIVRIIFDEKPQEE